MWSVVVAVVVVAWLAGVAFAQSWFSPTKDPLAGSRLFGSKGCVEGHGVNGVGGKVGPDPGRIPRPRSFFDLAAAMWSHLLRMVTAGGSSVSRARSWEAPATGDLITFL